MNNLATKNQKDFTVSSTGEAFISQTAIARATGIPQQTLSRWIIDDNGLQYNTNENNQLDAKSLQKIVIMGSSKYPDCLAFMGTLLEAGAKAFIYHQAGYVMEAKPLIPQTYLEALKQLVIITEELEKAKPAIEFHSLLVTENPKLSMNQFAKILTDSAGVKVGHNKLMLWMRTNKYFMVGRDNTEKNRPYQKYMDAGYFELEYINTRVGLRPQPFITSKGQLALSDSIVNYFK